MLETQHQNSMPVSLKQQYSDNDLDVTQLKQETLKFPAL